jgi:indolepyruvate ferredoxin oxidoreductase beta subunit
MGKARYPSVESLVAQVQTLGAWVVAFDGLSMAREAGNVQALNMVMVGAAAGLGVLPLSVEQLVREAEATFPAKLLRVNQTAINLGYTLGSNG